MSRAALVVGINQYSFFKDTPISKAKNLTTPATDAEAIAQLLEAHNNFRVTRLPASNINGKLQVDPNKPLKIEELEKAILDLFLPESGKPPETALLFFAGHGLRKQLRQSLTQGYLATSDASPSKNWGYSLRDLWDILQQSPVQQQVVWLDCCFSGELLNFKDTELGRHSSGCDRAFIAASRDYEVAYQQLDGKHGVLTGALLSGLDPYLIPEFEWITNRTLTVSVEQKLQAYYDITKVPQSPLISNHGETIKLIQGRAKPLSKNQSETKNFKNLQLEPNTINELVQLLRPFLEDERDRRPFLVLALGNNAPVLQRISWGIWKMQLEELPLLEIFNSLRQRHGLQLGVDDYLIVLRSLQAGFGISNRQELEQLCCLVWAKSDEENRLIQRLFKQMWQELPTMLKNEGECTPDVSEKPSPISSKSNTPSPEKPIPKSSLSVASSTETPTPEPFQPDESLPDLDIPPTITSEPVQAVQAVRSSRGDTEMKRPRYILLTEYFPVTKRQMKQCWRYLRRPVRQGVPTELDVEATVAKIGREGTILQPVLMPPRTNRTDLVLLIDQEGSMVPFHDLSRQLVKTAQRGGRLRTINVFYFHDYPDEYLYRHPAMLDAKLVSEVLEEIGERAVVLIVSDAGAARGNFDQERVDNTKVWIEQLQQSVRYFAWLNPMPTDCWRQTTSGEIARFVPMFEMSSQGMNTAISVLRGRYIVVKELDESLCY